MAGKRSWQAVGGGTAKRVGVEPRTGAVNTGHRSREARQHGIGSSESESKGKVLRNVFGGTFSDSFRQNLSLHPHCQEISDFLLLVEVVH